MRARRRSKHHEGGEEQEEDEEAEERAPVEPLAHVGAQRGERRRDEEDGQASPVVDEAPARVPDRRHRERDGVEQQRRRHRRVDLDPERDEDRDEDEGGPHPGDGEDGREGERDRAGSEQKHAASVAPSVPYAAFCEHGMHTRLPPASRRYSSTTISPQTAQTVVPKLSVFFSISVLNSGPTERSCSWGAFITCWMSGSTTSSGTFDAGIPFIRYSWKNFVCFIPICAFASGTTRTERPVARSVRVTPNLP